MFSLFDVIVFRFHGKIKQNSQGMTSSEQYLKKLPPSNNHFPSNNHPLFVQNRNNRPGSPLAIIRGNTVLEFEPKKKLTKPSYYNTTCQQNLNFKLLYFIGPSYLY